MDVALFFDKLFRYTSMNTRIMFRKLPILLAIGLITCVCNALAAGNYQVSAYLGGTTSNFNLGSRTINLVGETDLLVPTGNHQFSNLTWGFGAALRHNAPQALSFLLHEASLGLEYYYFSTAAYGEVWQYQDYDNNSFSYRLPVSSNRLLLTDELTFHELTPKTYPFFEWGIGVTANQVSFTEFPRPTFPSAGLIIPNITHYNFAYTLGAGLKMDLSDLGKYSQGLQLSLRYLYTNLGSANTSIISNIPITKPIYVSLYTQAWVAGLTYVF